MKKPVFCPFTLVELLMVCGIIIVLVGIGIGVYSLASRKSAEAKTEAMIKKMCVALEAYKDKTGYFIQQATAGGFYIDNPNSSDIDLNDFIEIPDTELGSGILRGSWRDPFGRDFLYRCPGRNNRGTFDLWSLGSDANTSADDITNWK